jgi:hypothetical protein
MDKEATLKTQPKWKSKIFWTGIASLVLMAFGNFGLYQLFGIPQGLVQDIINFAFTAAGVFGIWNDSSDAINY